MSTDTHDLVDKLSRDLIDKLSKDVKPVRPLPRAGVRAAVLCIWSVALAFLILHFLHDPRPDLAEQLRTPGYALQVLAMGLAGLLAAVAAFRLSIPDTRVRAPVKAMLALTSGLWLILILGEFVQVREMPEAAEPCLIGLTAAMSAPLALGLLMMMRAAPVWRGWAGYALLLSVGSFGALGMRVVCPSDSPAHLLVWHFLPVMAFTLLGVGIGKILLKINIAKK